jgi:GAF domain-containing protein
LGVAHINPIGLDTDLPEARAWHEQCLIATPADRPVHIAVPLLYCHQPVGVLVALRHIDEEADEEPSYWHDDELAVLEAVACVVALALEHARLLEQDHQRIHELVLLHDTANHLYAALQEPERMRQIIIQRTGEITGADLCDLVLLTTPGLATTPGESAESSSWLSPICVTLLQQECYRNMGKPFVVERPGNHNNPRSSDLLAHVPLHIKTLFAVPLLNGQMAGEHTADGGAHPSGCIGTQGMIVGAYCHNHKMRNAEMMLVRLLAGQASAALSIRRLQEEKRRLDHLASLGTMAAGVAHEVRNPLAGI